MEKYFIKITTVVRTETSYFFTALGENVRRVMLSNSFQAISSPLVSIFISAFIWKTTHSFVDVAAYNVGRYAFHPVMFYLNGFFLRKISIKKMFLAGSILVGISVLVMAAFRSANPWLLFLYGCGYGIGYGIYWANRNYLELHETQSAERQYYFSMISIIGGIASVLVPLVAGWFIVIGRISGWYTGYAAYFVLFVVSLVLMAVAGSVIFRGKFESPVPKDVSLFGVSRKEVGRRTLSLIYGFMDGINFIPALLVLAFIGNEAALGTITAAVSIVTILLTYVYGRFFSRARELQTLVASCLLFFACSALLALAPGIFSATAYVIAFGVSATFFGISFDPISLDLTNLEMDENTDLRYAYIVDNEAFLNIGRLASIFLAVGFAYFFKGGELIASPILAASVQLVLLAFFLAKFRKSRAS